jgi:hypothetical protein
MSDHYDKVPIACSLTTGELRAREETLLTQFRSGVVETGEHQNGYAFRIPGEASWIRLVAELMVVERECCPFLTFELTAEPNHGPMIMRVTGPVGTKEFLRTILCKTDEPAQ